MDKFCIKEPCIRSLLFELGSRIILSLFPFRSTLPFSVLGIVSKKPKDFFHNEVFVLADLDSECQAMRVVAMFSFPLHELVSKNSSLRSRVWPVDCRIWFLWPSQARYRVRWFSPWFSLAWSFWAGAYVYVRLLALAFKTISLISYPTISCVCPACVIYCALVDIFRAHAHAGNKRPSQIEPAWTWIRTWKLSLTLPSVATIVKPFFSTLIPVKQSSGKSSKTHLSDFELLTKLQVCPAFDCHIIFVCLFCGQRIHIHACMSAIHRLHAKIPRRF